MMHSIVHDVNTNLSSDESTNDLFSPVQGRHHSLHTQRQGDDDDEEDLMSPGTPVANGSDSLPRLADNSWLGARVSPIPSVNDEEDDPEELAMDQITAPYRKAMQDFGAHERSALLGRRIHPMWKNESGQYHNTLDDNKYTLQAQNRTRRRRQIPIWGKAIVIASSLHLFSMGLHDIFFSYLQLRRGLKVEYKLTWSLPWMAPSPRILLRFGAFSFIKIQQQQQWYRWFTSTIATASIMEWAVVLFAWWQLENLARSKPGPSTSDWNFWWPALFFASIATGQLWAVSFASHNAISGCASWGTCGVACAIGVSRPDHRLNLFLIAIALVLLNLFQPYSCVFGAIGASFFGWSFYGIGIFATQSDLSTKDHNHADKRFRCSNWLALVTLLKLWIIPLLYSFLLR